MRLRPERGPDPAGDMERGKLMARRKRDVERDCECVCGRWGKLKARVIMGAKIGKYKTYLTDRNQKTLEAFLDPCRSLHFHGAWERGEHPIV